MTTNASSSSDTWQISSQPAIGGIANLRDGRQVLVLDGLVCTSPPTPAASCTIWEVTSKAERVFKWQQHEELTFNQAKRKLYVSFRGFWPQAPNKRRRKVIKLTVRDSKRLLFTKVTILFRLSFSEDWGLKFYSVTFSPVYKVLSQRF